MRDRLHFWLYGRSRRYREARSFLISYQLHRLQGYTRAAALASTVANRLCGTPMYHYPKEKREQLRREREACHGPASG